MNEPKVHNALLMFRFIVKASFLNLGYPHPWDADLQLSKVRATPPNQSRLTFTSVSRDFAALTRSLLTQAAPVRHASVTLRRQSRESIGSVALAPQEIEP